MLAGILFDCRISPLASASSLSQQVPVSVGKGQQQTPTSLNMSIPGWANSAAIQAQSSSTELSHADEEQITNTASHSCADFGHLLPDALTSPLKLLMHHGLVPLENRPPREALLVYADQVAKDGSQPFSTQACTNHTATQLSCQLHY